MPTYSETIARYTVADWNTVIKQHRDDITKLTDRYGLQSNIAWVGEEIDILRYKIQQSEQRKAELIALAAGEENANI